MSAPRCALFASLGLVYAHKTRTVREVTMSNDMLTGEDAAAELYKLEGLMLKLHRALA